MRKQTNPRKRRSPKGARVTPSTVTGNIKARMDILIAESDLSAKAIFARLDLDGLGMLWTTFRGHVHTTRKALGQNLGHWRGNFSKARADGVGDLVFFALCNMFSRRFTDAVIARLVKLRKVPDLGRDT